MVIDIKPTTTLAALTQNNTSVPDSFTGFLPGLAKASAVSHEPLGVPQKAFGHRCDWYTTGANRPTTHPDIGITSYDPAYCARTAVDMKMRGLAGAFCDWYGPTSIEDKSLLALKPALEAAGLQFAICADKGIHGIKYDAATTDTQRTTVLLTALAYARKTYFGSPAYLRDGGKPIILFFGFSTKDFDWVKIRAALADCKLIFRWEYRPTQYGDRPYADGYFGWTDNSEEWIANVKAKAPGKLIIMGINGRFDNTDPVICPWGAKNPKTIAAQGGVVLQNQLAIARKHPEIPYLSVNTWNDYPEKSALEPGIPSEVLIKLELSSGVLNWNGGPMFAHYDVLVSTDGQNFMPLSRSDTPMLVDLDALEFKPGSYWFAVSATGKPFVQNAVSSVIKANLGWTSAP